MSFIARLKSLFGEIDRVYELNADSMSDLGIPEGVGTIYLSCTSTQTVTTIGANLRIIPNRILRIYGVAGTTTFTNNDGTTTKGQMDLGGSNRAVAATDVLELMQRADGTWVRTNFIDN